MKESEKLNKIDRNEFAQIIHDGIDNLSDFFHQIKYSKRILSLGSYKSIESLIFILNTFLVNQVTEIAAKAVFTEKITQRKMDRKERMVMVAQDCLQMQKDMFESVIAYQVDRNNARK